MADQLLSSESSQSNISTVNPEPASLVFSLSQVIEITAYSVLFLFGFCTNSLSLYKLSRERLAKQDKSRMTLLLIHLSVADLIVILFQVPEVWSLRGVWKADDVTCRITSFFQIFGFFISGFVMMVISVDRLWAIIFPLAHHANVSPRRTRIMLALAWLLALVCSIPQIFMYWLKTYPQMEHRKCTRSGFFEENNPDHMELLFVVYVFTLTWCLPVITMVGCHTTMVVHLYRRSKTMLGGVGVVLKAKVQTVKLTSVLVIGFILCSTPYNASIFWWCIGQARLSVGKKDFLSNFVENFAFVNNCLNPLFYVMVGKNTSPTPTRASTPTPARAYRRKSSAF